jgi:hypothetical protein
MIGAVLSMVLLAGDPEPRLVLQVAGLAVRDTVDEQVVAALGAGCFREDEGHGGGRYYVDPTARVTLHTEIGVDYMTETLELLPGVQVPDECRNSPALVSARLSSSPSVDYGLSLGMSEAALISALGAPARREERAGRTVLTYYADAERELYVAEYTFEGARLTRISIHDGC